MNTVVVREGFSETGIFQVLKSHFLKHGKCSITISKKISADLVFPFSDIAFFVHSIEVDDNKKDEETIQQISKIYNNLIIIVLMIRGNDSNLKYSSFLAEIPISITSVVCFYKDENQEYEEEISQFIYKVSSQFKSEERKFEKLIEERRKYSLDTDTQAHRIFQELIKEETLRNKLINLLENRTGTIRQTINEGLPDITKCDFYLENQ